MNSFVLFRQVSYLGFCGTLGADYIQYMIADETLVPQEYRRFYTEKIVYMPHSYFVNDHKQARRRHHPISHSRSSIVKTARHIDAGKPYAHSHVCT